MADTWGDIISRNYSAGRAIADDFVSARYSKKADELRSTYEARAKSEGKKLQDYLPDLESELRTLAAGVGATRRGVTDRKGQALDMGTMGRIRDDVRRGGEQRAGVLAMGGKQSEARQERAGALYSTGENFDDGQGQQVAGDTIAATSGAIGADGAYNAQKGALGLAKVGAQYGNAEAAAGQTEQADTFRMKSAAAKATQLYNLISNPESADADQIRGLWEGIKQDVPEYKNVDLQLQDGKVYIYENGKATGDLDPQEAAQLLQTAIQAPGQAIAGSMQAQLKAIEDQKAGRKDVDDKVLAASLKVVENLKAAGIPDTITSAALAAQKAVASTSGGWQLQDIGSEEGTFLMQKGGQTYVIKTNVAPDLASGEAGGALQVFAADGVTPLPGDVLNKQDAAAMQQSLVDLSVAKAQAGTALNFEVVGQQLKILNEIGAAYGGSQRSSVGAAPAGDTKQIQEQYKEIGAAHGFEITSMERGVLKGVGAGERSQHPKGTAVDYSVKGKTKEEGDALIADLRSAGYEVVDERDGKTGTGPHIHAELPPGASVATTAAAPKGAIDPKAPPAERAAAVAQSAPAQQTKVPGRKAAITAGGVGKQASDLRTLIATHSEQKAQLEKFDEEQGTEMGFVPGRGAGRMGLEGGTRQAPINLSSAQLRVREQLVSQLNETNRAMIDANRDTKASTVALNASEAARKGDEEAMALAAKYGGAADFFSRASQSGSR